jgi:hypothetical protein
MQEVGRSAMGFQRGVILVLFIDEESARLGFMPVDLVHQTSGLFTRFFGQLGKHADNIRFTTDLRHPRHNQNNHR